MTPQDAIRSIVLPPILLTAAVIFAARGPHSPPVQQVALLVAVVVASGVWVLLERPKKLAPIRLSLYLAAAVLAGEIALTYFEIWRDELPRKGLWSVAAPP